MSHEEVVATATGNLPMAPSPSYLAKNGEKGIGNLDILVKFHEIYADAELLREWSTIERPDGTRTIKNPMYFTQAINLRNAMLRTALEAARSIYDLQQVQRFWDAVIEE